MTEYLLKIAAVFVPVVFTIGWFLYPFYRRWRIRRMWKRQARNTAWLLGKRDIE